MDIITSHNALDFDGLASMVAANKLYPAAVKVFSGTLSKNVKKFMALYKDLLMVKSPKEIDLSRVKRMIVVDTANANRLGKLKELALKEDMDFYIYDHHPCSPDDLIGSIREIQSVGAATTILVEKLMENNIEISSFDATILALGIYEDTGSLLFSSTTSRDVSAVAYLLNRGANLSIVASFMELPFSGEQRELLQILLDSARHYTIGNMDVVIAFSDQDVFIPGLDVVTYRLFEVENTDAVLVFALMEGKVNVVGRSRTGAIKINEALQVIGGRGHEKAASAVVKGKNVEEVINLVMDVMKKKVNPGFLARDIMSTPVKTIPMSFSMEEAGRIMLRYGHTGMPVVDGDKMIGVISRRDVDKARLHDLGHAPVKGFMTTDVLTVSPDTPVAEVQELMVEKDIGRLPVIDNGRLVGIVSRTDILRTLHGDDYPEDHELLYSLSSDGPLNCLQMLEDRLPGKIVSILQVAGELAEEIQSTVYCVGGFVRDLFLQVPNFDIDLVVEGDGEKLALELAAKLGGRARIHDRFRTAVVILPDGFKIDVATARTEYYEFPAALPQVERSSIREDMYRRDFTINTLAICLNPGRFGELIDYFGGRRDLEKGYIRILYNFSFVEDPTRVLRAIRFEQRYNFTIEPDTLRFAKDAIERRLLGKLSYKRILQELILILSEQDPVPSLERMVEIGVWEYILPEVKLNEINRNMLKRVAVVIAWFKERYFKTNIRSWLVYILVIMSKLSETEVGHVLDRYHLDKQAVKSVRESMTVPEVINRLQQVEDIKSSDIDHLINNWTKEAIVYLLLCIRDEKLWEKVVKYLDCKEHIKVELNGHDLRELGIKEGPVYREILDELYNLKLNEIIKDRDDELKIVRKWMEEKYSYAVIN